MALPKYLETPALAITISNFSIPCSLSRMWIADDASSVFALSSLRTILRESSPTTEGSDRWGTGAPRLRTVAITMCCGLLMKVVNNSRPIPVIFS